jgi:hypothetical protein
MDFPVTGGAYDTVMSGFEDYFVVRLSSGGSNLIFSTFLGGSDSEGGVWTGDLALDQNNMAYLAGNTCSWIFQPQQVLTTV